MYKRSRYQATRHHSRRLSGIERATAELAPPQATPVQTQRLPSSVHVVSLVVACAVAALAFGFPLKGHVTALDGKIDGHGQIMESLKLPPADEGALYNPSWQPQLGNWQTVTVQQGDTLASIFDSLGLPADDARTILHSDNPAAKTLRNLPVGLILRLHRADGQLKELVFETPALGAIRIAREDSGYQVSKCSSMIEQRTAFATGSVHGSFLDSAARAGLSPVLSRRLERIFAHRIDFAKDVKANDRFTIIYREHFFNGEKLGDGDILAADLELSGHRYVAVGFPDHQGRLHYYTPDGKGIEPALMRYPLHFERVSSPFGAARMHPILGVVRPHTGIDLAAPRGTPIKAAGDGVIEYRDWMHGYGKTIMIDHGRGYETLYAHMVRFNPGLHDGERVTKGQVIGYVGATGLATGPHLHYEVRIDGVPRNPATVALPGDPPIAPSRLAAFRNQAAPLLAQIDLLNRTRVALRGD